MPPQHYIALAIVAISFALGAWIGGKWNAADTHAARQELADARAEWARERERLADEHTQAVVAVLTRERQLAQALADESNRYERKIKNAQTASDRITADLRNSVLQLRQRWAGCETRHLSATPPAAGEPDATAADRAGSAARIVRAAAACDAQVKGLQAILRAERKTENDG
jgi:hypothetical protein